jgi:hypothetical protein
MTAAGLEGSASRRQKSYWSEMQAIRSAFSENRRFILAA